MNITISGKDLKATEAIKDYAEKKMERLVKYFGEDFDVNLTIRTEREEQIAEVAVKAKTDTYRAVTAHKDLYASIDKDVDILEGQIRKTKTRKEKANIFCSSAASCLCSAQPSFSKTASRYFCCFVSSISLAPFPAANAAN